MRRGTATGDASVGTDTFTGVNSMRGSQFRRHHVRQQQPAGHRRAFDGRAGNDVIDGRGGFDTAVYNNDTAVNAGITVDMAAGTVTGTPAVGTDTLQRIEAIRGTNFADTYVATGFSGSSTNAGSLGTFNEFEGLGGNDTITGNGDTRIAFSNATAGVTVDLAAGTAYGGYDAESAPTPSPASMRCGLQFRRHISGDADANNLDGRAATTFSMAAAAATFLSAGQVRTPSSTQRDTAP